MSSKLTPGEWTAKTIRDLEERKRLKEKGKADADDFLINNSIKTIKTMSRIRNKKYRGK